MGNTGGGDKSDSLQLKGVSLLAQSLHSTLGPSKDVSDDSSGDPARKQSLFDVYASNFGSTQGLRFGEVFADSPSANYFLALSIVADNAARRCRIELLESKPDSPCACDTPEKAKAMLRRAAPSVDFTSSAQSAIVEKFAQRCKDDYVGAVSSLVSSLAFALNRQ